MAEIYLRSGKTPGELYASTKAAACALINAPDAKQAANVKALNDQLIMLRVANDPRLVGDYRFVDYLRVKEVAPSAVQSTPFLTNMSVQYGNGEYIGEMLMPVTPVPQLAGEYPIYDERSRMNPPDDSMSGRSVPNEITDGRSLAPYACGGFAHQNTLLVATMRNQMAPLNEMVDLVEAPAETLALRREMRIATVMTTAANYPSTNKKTLTAGVRWNDSAGDPRGDILAAMAALWTGHGSTKRYGWTTLDVWNVLRQHDQLLALMAADDRGLVSMKAFAEFFGLDGLLISESRVDAANEGQASNYGRVWGNFFGVCRVATSAQVRNAAFGYTMRWGGIEAQQWFDPRLGTLGAYVAKLAAHECHQVVASKTAYLITTPIN